MRGKLGLIVGLGVGYVLGTRAGRARYEQIKEAALKVWNLDPVQHQVDKVKDVAKSSALALPRTLWNTAVKVQQAASGTGTVTDRVSRGAAVVADEAPAVKRAAKKTAAAVEDTVDDLTDAAEKAVAKATKPAAKPAPKTAAKPATKRAPKKS